MNIQWWNKSIFPFILILSWKISMANPVQDTFPVKEWIPEFIAAGFIGAGIGFNHSASEQRVQSGLREWTGPDFSVKWDDYTRWVPMAEMYLADAFKVPAKNHWFDQTKYLFFATVLSTSVTSGLKVATHKTRPNGGELSWPSGHTTHAFTNATVLFEEFRSTAPVLAGSGYLFATGTGLLRMLNNKHWLSDVLAGAGIGILSTEIIYWIKPFKNFNPFRSKKDTAFSLAIDQQFISGYFVTKF
ncbi:MAG: phosphatase PAP2 family protein [Saprospiraceae bacterium]|nr:phosphatase PAP2 family protein [Saprospiraceae bacterium]